MLTRRNALSLALAAALVGTCIGAMAQPGGGRGEGPSPEMMARAQSLEVATVAQSLSLPADKTAKLAETYKAARESYVTAMRAKMTPGERPDLQVMREVTKAESAKFETAVKAFLTPEQTAAAVATLGTFNRRWDRMVLVLDDMGLAEKPKAEAMKLVMDATAESDKAMQAMAGGTDREAMRAQNEKMREKLDAALAKVLSAEQMTKWKAETAMRGPGGGRRGGPGGPAAPEAKPEPKPAAK